MAILKYENFQHYTYQDYKEWEGRWELIDGIAYSMSPAPYPKYQRVVSHIWRELDKNCEVYISPVDWKVNDNTTVQPNVAIFCEDTDKQFFSKTPPIIVEVLFKATAFKDVTTKFKLYEKERVEFYIILEPNSEISDIFRLIDGEYQLIKKATKDDIYRFELSNECSTSVDFSTLF